MATRFSQDATPKAVRLALVCAPTLRSIGTRNGALRLARRSACRQAEPASLSGGLGIFGGGRSTSAGTRKFSGHEPVNKGTSAGQFAIDHNQGRSIARFGGVQRSLKSKFRGE